jgi:serine/threonine protein kinase
MCVLVQVYLVQSRTTRQMYAMKVLNKQRVLQKEQVAYAMSERNVMSNLLHPYLVTLRFAFQTNHRLFLVMDYIEARTQATAASRPLAVRRSRADAQPACRGDTCGHT